ncbi:aldo/keto reductase [Streptomyces sp. VRA16 Mangrove soil]|uniref:aldo/keto reductase n=1 Tax=Streptomyces sp. VRA16 Mangrove soil TaxID=2817434 RepID=UPI001A9F379D|nr:aldo/keto reductase [Streptomyces sp. VRA16 Mangrove soil]MBO1329916.1 aldo/keto reductase [Streptomyces sp. VRA16 Mangrove soil]
MSSTLSARRLYEGRGVYPVGVSCWPPASLAHEHPEDDEERWLDGVRSALKHGTTLIALADICGLGRTERLLSGLWHEVPRESLQIACAAGHFRGTAPHPYAAPHLHHQLKQTLENLATDYLDLYVLDHTDFGPGERHLADAVRPLRAWRDSGVIRSVGLRVPGDGATADARRAFRHAQRALAPDVLVVEYNALTGPVLVDGTDVFDHAAERGLPVLVTSPLAHGLLAAPPAPRGPVRPPDADPGHPWFRPEILAAVREELRPLRERFGDAALPGLALRHCLDRSPDVVVLPGFGSPEQIALHYAGLDLPVAASDQDLIDATYAGLRSRTSRVTDSRACDGC